jgi:Aromatic-ring hydroxylase, C-terminal
LRNSYLAPRGAHPLTGQRVADLPLTDGRRLYETLRGGRFLLAAGPGALPGGPLPGDAAVGYSGRVDTVTVTRPSGTIALIRPDAYIAWAQGSVTGDRTPQIRDALARWCGSQSVG